MPERVLSPLGILPWRCGDCRKRFYATLAPLRFLLHARCPRCGNLELESIRRERLERNRPAQLATYLGAKAVRCEYCRENFAAWRLLWHADERNAHASLEQTRTNGE